MDEPVDIGSLVEDSTETQAPIYLYIKAILQSSETIPEKVVKLSDAIRNGANEVDDTEPYIWDLWMVVLRIAIYTPPDHPWQDVLVGSIQRIQQAGGRIPTILESEPMDWADLPDLDMCMLDIWFDPTELNKYWPKHSCSTEDIEMWKNQNSFTARITTEAFTPWLNFPILAVEDAVEENAEVEDTADAKKEEKEDQVDSTEEPTQKRLDKHTIWVCHLWIATEWILRAGDIIFRKSLAPGLQKKPTNPDKSTALAKLDTELPSRSESLPRWRKRLSEFVDQKETLGLSADLVERVAKSVGAIEKFQIDYPEAEEVSGPTKEAAEDSGLSQEGEKKTGGDGA